MAFIDSCNKANVAVYPIDVRGLVVLGMKPASGARLINPVFTGTGQLKTATFNYVEGAGSLPHLVFVQHTGGGSGRPGGGGGGGTGGGGGHGGGARGAGGGGGHGGGSGGGGHGGSGGGGHGGTGGGGHGTGGEGGDGGV